MPGRPQLIEHYENWRPSFDAAQAASRLLESVADPYLVGLRSVVLTNVTGRSRRCQREARSRRRSDAVVLARYHRRWRGELAWIEVFVDRLFASFPRTLTRIPVAREWQLGEALFHELGHHVHATQRPQHVDREIVADQWKDRFMRSFLRRRLRFVLPVLLSFRWLLRPVRRAFSRWRVLVESK